MAMGKRRRHAKQASMWVATQDLRSAPPPFSARLNQILEQHCFDGYVEGLCERFYADDGRPGLPFLDEALEDQLGGHLVLDPGPHLVAVDERDARPVRSGRSGGALRGKIAAA